MLNDTKGTNDTNPEETAGLERFFRLGGRGVDTAWSYRNQPAVGKAVRSADYKNVTTRAEVFITTKIECMGTDEAAYNAIEYDLKRYKLVPVL